MSKKKLGFGIILIMLTFSTLFMSVIPSIYAKNTAGKMYQEVITNFNFLKNEEAPYVLLYFGYVGCYTVCPPALNEISQIYKKIDKNKFTFYFVNLQENTPRENVGQFARVFNKDFKGVYLNNKEIIEVVDKLNVKYIPSFFDKNEIDHSGFLHVLKKDKDLYIQKFIYTTKPFDEEYIINDLNSL